MFKFFTNTALGFVTLLCIQSWNSIAQAFTFQVDKVSATWIDPKRYVTRNGQEVEEKAVSYVDIENSLTSNSIIWGEKPTRPGVINPGRSSLTFSGESSKRVVNVGSPFLLGSLTHINNTISAGTGVDKVAFKVDVDYTINPGEPTAYSDTDSFAVSLRIDETSNSGIAPRNTATTPWVKDVNCKYVGVKSCPDRIFPLEFLSSSIIEIENAEYTLAWSGLAAFNLSEEEALSSPYVPGVSEEGGSIQEDFLVVGRLVDTAAPKPPQVTIGNDQTINEGDLFSFRAESTFQDPLYEWDLNDDSKYDDWVGQEGQSRFLDEGSYQIRVKISDGGSVQEVSKPSTITVKNVAPKITFLTKDLQVKPGELFKFVAEAFDPGVRDILSFDWDLNGDGLFDDLINQKFGEFSFADEGLFSIGLKVSDGDGGEAFGSFNVNVTTVPEPSSVVGLLGLGLVGCLGSRVTRKSHRRLSRSEK